MKLFLIFLFFLNYQFLFSQDTSKQAADNTKSAEEIQALKKKAEESYSKGQINVIGDGKDSLKKIPGSATIVSKNF
jgi:hypothetical protein